jgi:hypothetical protein
MDRENGSSIDLAAYRQSMFIEPQIAADFAFGVLRRRFSDRTNNAVEYVRGKLHPIAPSGDAPLNPRSWEPTAYRHEVLLPCTVPDVFADARLLVERFEDTSMPGQKDLVITVKLTAPPEGTLHQFWETVRGFARAEFVEQHNLAVILAMHVPAYSGSRTPAPPHVHVMAFPRTIHGLGFTSYCRIANSQAQAPLVAAWKRYTYM